MPPKGMGGERGAVLLWMALMMVVFFAIASLAVDLGMGYAVKRQLSSTADAASLAGAQEAGLKFKTTNGCPSGVPDPALVTAVNAAVTATHDANAPWGSTGAPTPTITCDSNEVTVAVTERSDLDTFFARAIGVTSLSPAASATANVFGSNFGGGLRPFTVCVEDAVAGAVDVNVTQQSVYRSHNASTTPPTSGETLVEGGNTPWTASNDRIDPNKKMNLAVGDYVRLDIRSGADPASSGFYWVQDTPPNGKWITVSTTLGGNAVEIDSDGVVDVYEQPTPITGSWATDGTVSAPGHPLNPDDQVWIAIRSGVTGAASGYYFVTEANAATFKVSSTQGGTAQTLSLPGSIDVYEVEAPSTPASSCQPTGAGGNWGYANFALGVDTPVLKCLIDFGYGGAPGCMGTPAGTNLGDNDPSTPEVTPPPPGTPGNKIESNPQYIPRLTALVGKTIILPVAGGWTEDRNGANATYSARGGAAVQVCGFAFPFNDNDATPSPLLPGSCWEQSIYDSADTAGTLDKASLILQWRYVKEYTGSYAGQSSSSGDTCALGDPSCLPVVRLIG